MFEFGLDCFNIFQKLQKCQNIENLTFWSLYFASPNYIIIFFIVVVWYFYFRFKITCLKFIWRSNTNIFESRNSLETNVHSGRTGQQKNVPLRQTNLAGEPLHSPLSFRGSCHLAMAAIVVCQLSFWSCQCCARLLFCYAMQSTLTGLIAGFLSCRINYWTVLIDYG